MQFWNVQGRQLDARQMRAYRDGKLDIRTMKYLDSQEDIDKLKDVKHSISELKKDAMVSTPPERIIVQENEDMQATEPIEMTELEEFNKLKAIGYKNLPSKDRERYSELKKLLKI